VGRGNESVKEKNKSQKMKVAGEKPEMGSPDTATFIPHCEEPCTEAFLYERNKSKRRDVFVIHFFTLPPERV